MMNAARFDPNKFVNLSFAYSEEMRCGDAKMRRCHPDLCATLEQQLVGQRKGGKGGGQGKCLGCCSSATRHSKTLASYDNLSYVTPVWRSISKYRYR